MSNDWLFSSVCALEIHQDPRQDQPLISLFPAENDEECIEYVIRALWQIIGAVDEYIQHNFKESEIPKTKHGTYGAWYVNVEGNCVHLHLQPLVQYAGFDTYPALRTKLQEHFRNMRIFHNWSPVYKQASA